MKRDILGPNPLRQNQMARKHGGMPEHISTDYPPGSAGAATLNRGPGFLRYIKGDKWKFVLTVDEAWVYPYKRWRTTACLLRGFKWDLFDKHATTVVALKRVMAAVWFKLSQKTVDNALRSWQDRVSSMIERRGLHIEHRLSGGKFLKKATKRIKKCVQTRMTNPLYS